MRMTEPEKVWNPPGRTEHERRLDRLQVAGALVIVLAVVVAAVVTVL